MSILISEINAGGYRIRLSEPRLAFNRIIYTLNMGKSQPFATKELMATNGFALAEIFSQNYTSETTPYPAQSPSDKNVVYEGKSDEFIAVLENAIMPQVETHLSLADPIRCFVGYSLGGLLAYVMAFCSNSFSRIGCVSPSLWYENIIPFSEQHSFSSNLERLYFSLGAKESLTANPVMSTIAANTQKLYELTEKRGIKTVYEINPGGHFTEPNMRMSKAAKWLTEK